MAQRRFRLWTLARFGLAATGNGQPQWHRSAPGKRPCGNFPTRRVGIPAIWCRSFPDSECRKTQECRIRKNPIDKTFQIPYTHGGIENGFACQVVQGMHRVEKAQGPYFLQSWIRKNCRPGCINYGVRSAVSTVDMPAPVVYTDRRLLKAKPRRAITSIYETGRGTARNVWNRQHAL
jgi:hypothetical protein